MAAFQLEAEKPKPTPQPSPTPLPGGGEPTPIPQPTEPQPVERKLKRFHGTVNLDPTRVGRDAGKIAEEVISHLVGLVGAKVTVTLEVEAEMPDGAPDQVVRIVTENGRTLKFVSQGLSHYAIKYNRFMGVISDYFTTEE